MLMAAQLVPELLNLTVGFCHESLIYNLNEESGAATITTYRKTVLIYNPYAGRFRRKGEALIASALEILRQGGHNATALPTTGPGTAGTIARCAIDAGADRIV